MPSILISARTAAHPGGSPVEGIEVALYDEDAVLLQTDATDEDGVVNLGSRDPGTYEVRLTLPPNGRVENGRSRFHVVVTEDDPAIFDMLVSVSALPVADVNGMCRCSGTFWDSAGLPLRGVSIAFTPQRAIPNVMQSAGAAVGILRTAVLAKTNKDGHTSVDLIRGGVYSVSVSSMPGSSWEIEIPDQSSAQLADVVFPAPSGIEYSDDDGVILPTTAPSLLVNQGTTVAVDLQTVFASGLRTDGLCDVGLQVSATGYARFSLSAAVLSITGLFPGTVTLTPYVHYSADGYGFSRGAPVEADELFGTLTVTVVDDPDVEDPDPPEDAPAVNPPLLLDGGVI